MEKEEKEKVWNKLVRRSVEYNERYRKEDNPFHQRNNASHQRHRNWGGDASNNSP